MLVIHDEKLARRLQDIASNEQRPVEAVLETMLDQYPAPKSAANEVDEAVRRIRLKAYAKARAYWEQVGDTAKLALTDAELDEQFGVFDEEGIPRLKSDLSDDWQPPIGSLAYMAKIADEMDIWTEYSIDVTQADDILNAEFADYLLSRMRGEDGPS